MKGFSDRNQLLAKMRDGQCNDWDIIIVGGGITGAGGFILIDKQSNFLD